MSRTILIALALVVGVGGAFFALRGQEDESSAQRSDRTTSAGSQSAAPATVAALEDMQRQLARLEGKLNSDRRNGVRRTSQADLTSPGSEATVSEPGIVQRAADDGVRQQQARAASDALFEKLGSQFAQEKSDSSWGDDVQGAASEVISAQGLKDVSVASIDCRQTLCEITLNAAGPAGQTEATQLLTALPFEGGNLRVASGGEGSEGQARIQVFASKKGTRPNL